MGKSDKPCDPFFINLLQGVELTQKQLADALVKNHVVQMNVLTVLNGTTKAATMSVSRYAEVIGSTARAKDILTGRYYDLTKDLQLKPRQSLVLEF